MLLRKIEAKRGIMLKSQMIKDIIKEEVSLEQSLNQLY